MATLYQAWARPQIDVILAVGPLPPKSQAVGYWLLRCTPSVVILAHHPHYHLDKTCRCADSAQSGGHFGDDGIRFSAWVGV